MLSANECSSGVDVYGKIKLLHDSILNSALIDSRCIVDQYIDASEGLDSLLDSLPHTFFISNINLKRKSLSTGLSNFFGSSVNSALKSRISCDSLSSDDNIGTYK